jgi:hypothetical protein
MEGATEKIKNCQRYRPYRPKKEPKNFMRQTL